MDRSALHWWFRPLARLGYAARGIVYLVIGGFAAFFAIGGGEMLDSRDAIRKLFDTGFGGAVAVVLVGGFAAFAVWRLIQSLLDTDDHGWSAKGLGIRIGLLASAATYSALGLYTWSIWSAGGGDGGGGGLAPRLSNWIGSRWTALVLAIVFLIVAIAHFAKAWRRGYRKHMRGEGRRLAIIDSISRTGLFARGLTFLVISGLFGWRAWTVRDEGSEDVGLRDALQFISDLPAGQWLLAAMGFGLFCFGLYSLAEARWRQINVEDAEAPGQSAGG